MHAVRGAEPPPFEKGSFGTAGTAKCTSHVPAVHLVHSLRAEQVVQARRRSAYQLHCFRTPFRFQMTPCFDHGFALAWEVGSEVPLFV